MRKIEVIPWSQTPVYPALRAIGAAMNGRRLSPEILRLIPTGDNTIIAEHFVEIVHISGKELKQNRGKYCITIEGPRLRGRWLFFSGDLEKAAGDAAKFLET